MVGDSACVCRRLSLWSPQSPITGIRSPYSPINYLTRLQIGFVGDRSSGASDCPNSPSREGREVKNNCTIFSRQNEMQDISFVLWVSRPWSRRSDSRKVVTTQHYLYVLHLCHSPFSRASLKLYHFDQHPRLAEATALGRREIRLSCVVEVPHASVE
jgi:hypothetical protein